MWYGKSTILKQVFSVGKNTEEMEHKMSAGNQKRINPLDRVQYISIEYIFRSYDGAF